MIDLDNVHDGDQVEITLQGRFSTNDGGETFWVGGCCIASFSEQIVSFRVLPKPFPEGKNAIVTAKNRDVPDLGVIKLIKDDGGRWVDVNDGSHYYDSIGNLELVEVIFSGM